MKGLVLAGGTGSRLRPLTHTGPKQLIPIANKPNILYCLEDLRAAGITEVAIILGNNMPDRVRALLGDGSAHGLKLTYVHQGEPKGIAHAVLCARQAMGDGPFIVYLGDNVLKGGVQGLVDAYRAKKADAVIGLCQVPNPSAFGVAVLDAKGRVVKTLEKPNPPPSDLAVIGVYLFTPKVFPIIERLKPSGRGELEITDAITGLITSGHKVESHVVTGWWKDTGRPEDILEANHLVLDDVRAELLGTVEPGADVRGKVRLEAGATIAKGAVVRGPCIIGKGAQVRSGAYIGPYSAIGPGCLIEGAEIENSILLEGVQIRTKKRITDSLIGARCQILDAGDQVPKGHRLVLGENSQVRL